MALYFFFTAMINCSSLVALCFGVLIWSEVHLLSHQRIRLLFLLSCIVNPVYMLYLLGSLPSSYFTQQLCFFTLVSVYKHKLSKKSGLEWQWQNSYKIKATKPPVRKNDYQIVTCIIRDRRLIKDKEHVEQL